MFNLIVAVISIALIAAMAAASIFYGGTAFSSGTAQAAATTLVNNGQQISGAQQLYMIDTSGNRAELVATLNGEYLQAVPTPPSMASGVWEISDTGLIASIPLNFDEATGVCAEVVEGGGQAIAAAAITTAAGLGTSQYGCWIDTTGSTAGFAYKL